MNTTFIEAFPMPNFLKITGLHNLKGGADTT